MFLNKRKEKIRLAAPSHTGYEFNKTVMLPADECIQAAISFNRIIPPFRAGLQPPLPSPVYPVAVSHFLI